MQMTLVYILILLSTGMLSIGMFVLKRSLVKGIELEYNKGLEAFKGTIAAETSDIRATIDLYSATHTYIRKREVESIESMYRLMLKADTEFSGLMFCDWCITVDEIKECIEKKDPKDKVYRRLREYENYIVVSKKHGRCLTNDAERLFVRSNIATLYDVYLRVLARAAFLIAMSFNREKFIDWRQDNGMSELLGELDGEIQREVRKALSMEFGGLGFITRYIKAAFIVEAWSLIYNADEAVKSASDIRRGMETNFGLDQQELRSYTKL